VLVSKLGGKQRVIVVCSSLRWQYRGLGERNDWRDKSSGISRKTVDVGQCRIHKFWKGETFVTKMHVMNYTRFIRGKNDLLKNKFWGQWARWDGHPNASPLLESATGDGADVTFWGRLFYSREAATGKAQSPMVELKGCVGRQSDVNKCIIPTQRN